MKELFLEDSSVLLDTKVEIVLLVQRNRTSGEEYSLKNPSYIFRGPIKSIINTFEFDQKYAIR